jgi:hypothetical protein
MEFLGSLPILWFLPENFKSWFLSRLALFAAVVIAVTVTSHGILTRLNSQLRFSRHDSPTVWSRSRTAEALRRCARHSVWYCPRSQHQLSTKCVIVPPHSFGAKHVPPKHDLATPSLRSSHISGYRNYGRRLAREHLTRNLHASYHDMLHHVNRPRIASAQWLTGACW